MISTKRELREFLKADSKNFITQRQTLLKRIKGFLFCNPINDDYIIWNYIDTLRKAEYYINTDGILSKFLKIYYLHKLRNLAYKTGFQIPPNVVDMGITIYHWGSIIINQNCKIGKNVTLYPGVLIGWKSPNTPCPQIGDNVFIGAGTKVIGNVKIGDNVIIGQNCVITKDIPDNTVVVTPKFREINKQSS